MPAWLGVTSHVLTQPVVVANPLGGEPLQTHDGIPQGDPLRDEEAPPQPARPQVTWAEVNALMARNQKCFRTPPRSCGASLGTLVCQMLTDREESDSPAVRDFLLLLPKLVWPAEVGTNGRRHEKNVQRRLAWAHQGRWTDLMREALARPATLQHAHEPADAFAEGGLSPETARRLYRAAATGQLGKAWKQLRAPPPQTVRHGTGLATRPRQAAAARRPTPGITTQCVYPSLGGHRRPNAQGAAQAQAGKGG